ncbi:hypothetical protein MUK42_08905 [Musa troglodytarum]|uniref:Uncharacterized protein n=1 Tax=Musa troglodytarum TaxID=320322 RepID=A0A9E7FMA7_9LILI|nr:hypothetical protein MUK42_08905 [Musa troglodytarum]
MNREDDELTWSGCHRDPPGPPFYSASISSHNPAAVPDYRSPTNLCSPHAIHKTRLTLIP